MLKKTLLVFIVSLFILGTGSFSQVDSVSAQTGGQVGVCTYYNANNFKSRKQCEQWLLWAQQANTPAWKKKLDNCMLTSAITISPTALIKELRVSPKAALATYGASFASCMFGS